MAVSRVAIQASTAQLSALKLFADANGLVIAHAGVKVMNVTHDISLTGAQAITGAGFKPSAAIVFVTVNNTVQASYVFTDGSSTFGVITPPSASGTAGQHEYTNQLVVITTGAGVFSYASHTSWDSDGMTINWSKTGSPTGTAQINIVFLR